MRLGMVVNGTVRPRGVPLGAQEADHAARIGDLARQVAERPGLACVLLDGHPEAGLRTAIVIDRDARVAARIRADQAGFDVCRNAWLALSPRFGPGLVVDLQGHVWSFIVARGEGDGPI